MISRKFAHGRWQKCLPRTGYPNISVTRGTVEALTKVLDINETQVIHMALSKFAHDILPAYAPDDGPLTAKQIRALRKDANQHLPKGKTISSASLFA